MLAWDVAFASKPMAIAALPVARAALPVFELMATVFVLVAIPLSPVLLPPLVFAQTGELSASNTPAATPVSATLRPRPPVTRPPFPPELALPCAESSSETATQAPSASL